MEGRGRQCFGHDIGHLSFGADVIEVEVLRLDALAQVREPGHDVLHALGRDVRVREHYCREVVTEHHSWARDPLRDDEERNRRTKAYGGSSAD